MTVFGIYLPLHLRNIPGIAYQIRRIIQMHLQNVRVTGLILRHIELVLFIEAQSVGLDSVLILKV